jgi:RNA polymerase sigma factor (sigma-70 family)
MAAPKRPPVLTEIALSMESQLRALLNRYSGNPAIVQELLQDLHVRIISATVQNPKRAAAYIYKAAKRIGMDWRQRERIAPVEFRPDFDLPQVAYLLCPERQVSGLQILEQVVAIVPPRCQRAFGLVKGEGYTCQEAAIVMELSDLTVETHVRNAVAKIRDSGIEVGGYPGSCKPKKSTPSTEVTRLADACRGLIRAYHERYAKDRREVEALVHETYRCLVTYSSSQPRSMPEFLLEEARNSALRRLRSLSVIPIDAVADIERLHTLGVDQEIEVIARTNRNMAVMSAALKSLPRRCREVFLLYKMDSCTTEEISGRLGISEAEVTERLVKAVRHFEKALSKNNEANGKTP